MQKMAKIRVDDLEMRPDMFGVRLKDGRGCEIRSMKPCRLSIRRSNITI